MEKELKEKIKSSGYKKKYLADKIGISQNYLSMCITGKRNMSEKKQTELKTLL